MSRPNDARALRSRDALRSALLKLIDATPLDQISIKDITLEAKVSYPVFFRRYASKEELFDDIAREEVHHLLDLTLPVFEADAQNESLRVLCNYVHDHRPLWTRLLTGGAANAMRDEFLRSAREIGAKRPQANPWLPRELAATFVVNSLFDILAWWLRQPENYPIENVVTLIDILVVRATAKQVDVHLI
jgi:AcrR family transcriptional regulator